VGTVGGPSTHTHTGCCQYHFSLRAMSFFANQSKTERGINVHGHGCQVGLEIPVQSLAKLAQPAVSSEFTAITSYRYINELQTATNIGKATRSI